MQMKLKERMKMLKVCRILMLLLVIFLLASCQTNGNSAPSNGDDVITGDEQLLVKPNNLLSFSLLEQIEPVEDNIFISPVSALMALLLVYNGADGETMDEMAETLHLEDYSLADVNEAILALTNSLEIETEAIDLTIANSIWLNDNLHFHDDYTKAADQYFAAQYEMIDIEDDRSVDQMNEWVSEATNDKITDMVEKPLNANFVAMILNAIYFNGKWQYEFDEAFTADSIFYTDDEMTVPFMMLEEELAYIENELFQAVELPYGSGEMSVQFFLPNEEVGIEGLKEEWTEENWTVWQSEFRPISGTVKLPKFQVEYETSLNKAFQQLGMELAFDERHADFPHMIEEDEQIFIHEIKQKTYIDITEEGTEAAGATSVEMRLTSAVVDEDSFYMEVNRPFFFTITDEETNAILFMGIIQNPKQG